MDLEVVLEYAKLAQQCYNIDDSSLKLPQNWHRINCWAPKDSSGNFYALYVNETKKEVVFGIRGTCNFSNYLSNAALLKNAINNDPQPPPGQENIERWVQSLPKYQFRNKKNEDIFDMNAISKAIKETHTALAESTINYVLLSMFATGIVTFGDISHFLDSEKFITVDGSLDLKLLREIAFKKMVKICKEAKDLNLKKLILEALEKNKKSYYTLTIVGHSLGGLMAELCALYNEVRCFSFESPGSLEIMRNIERYNDKLERNEHLIHTYLSAPNIINTLFDHPGCIYRMFLSHEKDGFSWIHFVHSLFSSICLTLNYASFALLGAGSTAIVKQGIDEARAIYNDEIGLVVFFSSLLSLFFLNVVIIGITLCRDKNWLCRQHSIDNIVKYLERKSYIKKMKRWPHIFNSNEKGSIRKIILRKSKELLKNNLLPFQPDCPGIMNIFKVDKMREAQLRKMPGYEEFDDNYDK